MADAEILKDAIPSDYSSDFVSLVIPVYNEAGHLEEFLRTIDALQLPAPKELVIVDDCSKDASVEIVRNFPFQSHTVFAAQRTNQGKGAALRLGFELARGTIIGIQDADFEYDPQDIPRLVEPLLAGKADVCFGSRYKSSQQVHRTFHYLVNRILTLLSNFFTGIYLSDMETCYKFFRADLLKNLRLNSNRFGFEPEVTAKIAKLKVRISEIPISYFPRNYIEGKKITWKDGLAALRHIVYYSVFENRQNSFKKELPPKYVPQGLNLL